MNDQLKHPSPDEIQAYLDGELGPPATIRIEEHLKTCSSCQSELSRLGSLLARLESLEEFSLKRDLSPMVLEQIQREKQVPLELTWTLLAEGIGAGLVIGLLIPAIRSTLWIPRLVDTQLEVRAAINIFLTQLVSSWTFWWAQLRFDFSHLMDQFSSPFSLPAFWPSPWILILSGGVAGLLVNFILLRNSIQAQNGNQKD